jgi:tol-pal system protein YbgF
MPTFKTVSLKTLAVAAALSLTMLGGFAQAQSDVSNRISKLEQDVQRLQRSGGKPPPAGTDPTNSEGMADMLQRILALERIVEQLTGQIEETRFNAERTAKQTQVLQDDVSLRLARIEQSLGMTGAPAAAAPPAAAPSSSPGPQGQLVPTPAAPATAATAAATPSDALSEPVSQQSRNVPSSAAPIVQANVNAPPGPAVNDNGGFVIRTDAAGRPLPPDPNAPPPPPAPPEPTPQQAAPKAAPNAGPVSSGQVASLPAASVVLPAGTPKQQYEFAFDFLKRQDYPRAESALRQFLQAHPKDALAGNAQYWLGETYYVRGDFQQAAVEFMGGYQKYPKTNKGPDNLLKLGMSMSKLNQKEGACTALSRISKDYPDAPDAVLKQAQGERTKLKCK